MTDVSIRIAKRLECEACLQVYHAAWAGMDFVPQGLHSHAEDRRWMREVFAHQLVLVAEVGTSDGVACSAPGIVGLLSMSDGTVHNFYIRPGYQGRGIGQRLLETAKTCSGGRLQLWVFEPNHGAIRFYERHGFVTIRKTDGRENEEKVPDRLMAWRSDGI